MDDIKRRSSVNQLSKKKAKKLRSEVNRSITCIENLSNEIFYEIFDYLDGCEIHEAFSYLNYRFQQLLDSSSLLFKIRHDYSTSEQIFLNNYEHMIVHKRNQIYSISLYELEDIHIISLFMINSSFNHLESLTFYQIEADRLARLLTHLTCLPRLFSLNINTQWALDLETLSDIYQLIFALPKLKFIEFDTDIGSTSVVSLPLSIATDKQFSSIKHLYIHHSCDMNELFTLMSYTPELCRLKLALTSDMGPSIESVLPITLSNLTYILIHEYDLEFGEFEMLIRKIACNKLKVLHVNLSCLKIPCFDANRWEKLIRQYLPQLRKLYLTYASNINENSDQLKQFFSSFWIERQWIMEVEIQYNRVMYAIRSYRKKWYEYIQNNTVINSSMLLILRDEYSEENFHLLKLNIDYISNLKEISHLEISKVFINASIKIIDLLPKLDSLKISSFSLKQLKCLSINERELINLISNKNQITKVNIEKINDIEEVCFLLELCPRMIYLKIDFINNIDIELFLRLILLKIQTKCHHQFRLLCFSIPSADDGMIKMLQTMIDFEKILLDYTIKRIQDFIYLQWK